LQATGLAEIFEIFSAVSDWKNQIRAGGRLEMDYAWTTGYAADMMACFNDLPLESARALFGRVVICTCEAVFAHRRPACSKGCGKSHP
jgi:hypothetical protein